MVGKLWTIIDVLKWTTGYFEQKGIDQPRATAEVLLAHALGVERIQLYLHYDRPLDNKELKQFRALIQRRVAREPTQYITGRQEFWSLELEVTPAVLIPRPETEVLVETTLGLGKNELPIRVLDLATGSGAIAIALAHERPSWIVFASDISFEALKVASRNARRHGLERNIHFVTMDLFEAISPRSLFDIIVANLPYVSEREFPELVPEITMYEPKHALLGGGDDGLGTIRNAIYVAHKFLKPEGYILLEIGMGQASILESQLKDNPYYTNPVFVKDYSGILRVLCLRKRAISDSSLRGQSSGASTVG